MMVTIVVTAKTVGWLLPFDRCPVIALVVVGHKTRTRAGMTDMSARHAVPLQASLVA